MKKTRKRDTERVTYESLCEADDPKFGKERVVEPYCAPCCTSRESLYFICSFDYKFLF
jgi:hypothetical protein